VVIGSVIGAVVASFITKLDRATNVIPLAISVGFLMIGLVYIDSLAKAVPFLSVMGGICGFLIVPRTALRQLRGHNLMGGGRSIAVQNFNEQACILGLGALYVVMTRFGMSAFGAILVFGVMVAVVMEIIRRWHRHNTVQHADEVGRLLEIARTDRHH
ncbi:MAG: lysophospholipid transporter LplT, partial [Betaproteobacteria bacterium]